MKLYDACSVIRSKNAGPFKLTCDLFFTSERTFTAAKSSGVITVPRIAELFAVSTEQVTVLEFLDRALALKISLVTNTASGDQGSRDIYGSQQAAVLFDLDIPVDAA